MTKQCPLCLGKGELEEAAPIKVGSRIVVHYAPNIVTVDGENVGLSRKEFKLFEYFSQRQSIQCTHIEILKSVWGLAWADEEYKKYIRVFLSQIKEKMNGSVSFKCRVNEGYTLVLQEDNLLLAK